MRVLAVAQSSVHSGAEAVFEAIVTGLAERADVELLVAVPDANAALAARMEGDPRVERLAVPGLSTRAPAFRAWRPGQLRAVRRLLREAAADVVLVNLPSAEHGGALLRLAGAPTVGLVHVPHTPVQMGSRAGRARTALTRAGTRRATMLCALTDSAAELVRGNWAGPGTDVGRFPLPAVRLERPARDAARARFGWGPEPVVGLAGRIASSQKGHAVFVEAAALLREEGWLGRFALAGDGPDAAAVRADVAARGLGDAFVFLGHVEIGMFLAAVDVLAMPSFYEGLPLVALEALAAGTRGVASAIPGLADVWPAPWQVAPGDAPALAAAVRAVVALPAADVARELAGAAENARRYVADDPSVAVAHALRAATTRRTAPPAAPTRHRRAAAAPPHADATATSGPGVSVIATVLDAGDELEPFVAGLLAQTHLPDELVVVDGGSTDGTLERLRRLAAEAPFAVRVIEAPGTGISAGRNVAVRAAAYDWIAATDAGCRADPDWLAALATHRGTAALVSGVYRVEGATAFEAALSVALYPDVTEIADAGALTRASHRVFGRAFTATAATGRSVAFTRVAWEVAGGFDETVAAGEDTHFARAVAAVGPAVLEPRAAVGWRPRPTWPANARMYAGYARGDVALGRPHRHAIRFLAWVGFGAALATRRRGPRAAAFGWLLAYCELPARRARRRRLPAGVYWRIPLVLALKDAAMMAGALRGIRDAAGSADVAGPDGGTPDARDATRER